MDQPTPTQPQENSNPPENPGQENPAPKSFEMPPDVTAPEPMGGKPSPEYIVKTNSAPTGSAPGGAPIAKPSKMSYIFIIILVVILIIGILMFGVWKGWFSLGGFGGAKTSPSPSSTSSPVISPMISSAISPTGSPSAVTSPSTVSNVNDVTRKNDLASLKNALKKYYAEKTSYPVANTSIKTSDKTSVLYQALAPAYLESLPDDPMTPQNYYGYKSDGINFELTAVLEDKSDPAGAQVGSYYIYKVTDSSAE